MHHLTRAYRHWAFALILVAAASSACASRSRAGRNAPKQPPTYVEVQNQNWTDMTIYVFPGQGGQRIRLGTVTGTSTSTFLIPSHLVFGATSLRFLADPLAGSSNPVSEAITVTPGDTVTLTIPQF